MNRLAAALAFVGALGAPGCRNESNKPVPYSASTVYEIPSTNPDVIFIQATLRLARERCMGGRPDNAGRALQDVLDMQRNIEGHLNPQDRHIVEKDIDDTRTAIISCLSAGATHP